MRGLLHYHHCRIEKCLNINIKMPENINKTRFYEKMREFLTEKEADEVVELLEILCPHCLDAYKPCFCWNDE